MISMKGTRSRRGHNGTNDPAGREYGRAGAAMPTRPHWVGSAQVDQTSITAARAPRHCRRRSNCGSLSDQTPTSGVASDVRRDWLGAATVRSFGVLKA